MSSSSTDYSSDRETYHSRKSDHKHTKKHKKHRRRSRSSHKCCHHCCKHSRRSSHERKHQRSSCGCRPSNMDLVLSSHSMSSTPCFALVPTNFFQTQTSTAAVARNVMTMFTSETPRISSVREFSETSNPCEESPQPEISFPDEDDSDVESRGRSRSKKKKHNSRSHHDRDSSGRSRSPDRSSRYSSFHADKKRRSVKDRLGFNTSAPDLSGLHQREERRRSASRQPDHSTPFSATKRKRSLLQEDNSTPDTCFRTSSAAVEYQNKRRRTVYHSAPSSVQKARYSFSPHTATVDLLTYESKIGFIDTHCHLDFLFSRIDFAGVHSAFRKFREDYPVSFKGCITVFCEPVTFKKRSMWRPLMDEPGVWGAFGCHPHYADQFNSEVEEDLKIAIRFDKVVGFGEIGLDFSIRNGVDRVVQENALKRQLKILKELERQLPVIIHCREAHDECFPILKEELPSDYPIHLHCFNDSWPNTEMWLSAFPNLYIGVTNLVTKDEAWNVHELVKNIPLNRLLLETDAPYFVPSSLKPQERVSHPGMAIHVADKISKIKGVPLEDTLETIMKNTKLLYHI